MQNLELDEAINKVNKKDKTIYLKIKRLFDIVMASSALIAFLPIFLLLVLLIRLDSSGAAIFGHKRIGKDGKEIKVYKFRSMVINAQEVLEKFTPEQKREFEKNFKLENDPRITRIGNFLRKTSLDELPQLINIIKGDMSIVGPRPIVKAEIPKYGKYAEKMFSVTPGLTGHWQANGRSDTTYDERVAMDMYYIDNRSFSLDIKIIFQTVVSVITKKGAI